MKETSREPETLLSPTDASVVRLLPALCLSRELATRFLEAFRDTLRNK